MRGHFFDKIIIIPSQCWPRTAGRLVQWSSLSVAAYSVPLSQLSSPSLVVLCGIWIPPQPALTHNVPVCLIKDMHTWLQHMHFLHSICVCEFLDISILNINLFLQFCVNLAICTCSAYCNALQAAYSFVHQLSYWPYQ